MHFFPSSSEYDDLDDWGTFTDTLCLLLTWTVRSLALEALLTHRDGSWWAFRHKLARLHGKSCSTKTTSNLCDGCLEAHQHYHNDAAKANENEGKNQTNKKIFSCHSWKLMSHMTGSHAKLSAQTLKRHAYFICVALPHTAREVYSFFLKQKRWGPSVFAVLEMHSLQKSSTWDKQTSSPWYISYSVTFAWWCLMLPRLTL